MSFHIYFSWPRDYFAAICRFNKCSELVLTQNAPKWPVFGPKWPTLTVIWPIGTGSPTVASEIKRGPFINILISDKYKGATINMVREKINESVSERVHGRKTWLKKVWLTSNDMVNLQIVTVEIVWNCMLSQTIVSCFDLISIDTLGPYFPHELNCLFWHFLSLKSRIYLFPSALRLGKIGFHCVSLWWVLGSL